MKTILLSFALLVSSLIAPASQAAEAARTARVATGAEVKLVPSSQTAAQWNAQRPKVSELRPKVRGTFE